MNLIQIEIQQSCFCDSEDRKNEQWKSKQKKHVILHECNTIHECNQKKQNSNKSQQDDTELWEFVLSKTHKNWKSWQDFYNMKKIEACCFHVYLEHIIQINSDNKNAVNQSD